MDDQRLVSLDTLLALGDGLRATAHGNATGRYCCPLAEELTEFQMPRPDLYQKRANRVYDRNL